MTEENIRKMVEKYEIKDNRDGRIRAYHVKTDEEKKQIGEHKAEILAYLKREEEKKKEEYLRKTSFFESIPGVKEIRKAREEWRDYQFEFQRAFERAAGLGMYPASFHIMVQILLRMRERAATCQNPALKQLILETVKTWGDGYECTSRLFKKINKSKFYIYIVPSIIKMPYEMWLEQLGKLA